MKDTHHLLNTLYVTRPGLILKLRGETIRIEEDGKKILQVPFHHLTAIVVFGWSSVSAGLIYKCAETGIGLVWLSRSGRFQARISGPVAGNVLLRQEQYRTLDNQEKAILAARAFVAGKIRNCRQSVLRSARDLGEPCATALRHTGKRLKALLDRARTAPNVEILRGAEGEAARAYFGTLGQMIQGDDPKLRFSGRNRRPPRDPVNALLSFLYTLLAQDCVSGLETVGLDPAAGFLHALRPGRPALALDLMEEFRPVLADRLALTLLNRRQLTADDFNVREGGSVIMRDEARKKLVVAYQKRKKAEVSHPLLKSKIPLGLAPHLQARLLARWLRGDVEHYVPYIHK